MSAAENAGGWADADKPGVPLNPERDGWHWLRFDGSDAEPHLWCGQQWMTVPDDPRDGCDYLGPCLTPQEVAAREAAAWCAAIEAAAEATDERRCVSIDPRVADAMEWHAHHIRALTPPADMAAALEAVRREGMEAAAQWHDTQAEKWEAGPSYNGNAQRQAAAHREHAAAIRARGEAE